MTGQEVRELLDRLKPSEMRAMLLCLWTLDPDEWMRAYNAAHGSAV